MCLSASYPQACAQCSNKRGAAILSDDLFQYMLVPDDQQGFQCHPGGAGLLVLCC